ncbi:MAG: ribosome assembly cofactor RimP [Cyanobium sp.]
MESIHGANSHGQSGAPALSPSPASPELDAALQQLASGVASDSGLTVLAIRLLSHRIPLTVQVLVQRADGLDVSLDECARFSAPLGEALEASELLGLSYVLEVSSPGIGEDLASDRDYTSFRGFPVQVVVRQAEGGGEQLRQGLLLGRDERMVLLNMRGRTVRIPREEVVRVRLICPTDDS